jgi:plastocyanin
MRKGIWLAVAAAAWAALAPGLAVGQSALADGGTRVLMVDNEPDLTNWHFEPAEVTIPAGSTVVWHNKGKEEHSVTADNKSFDSGWKPKGGNYQRTFTRPGTYAYHCAPHPWMKGVVRVVAAPAAPAVTPAPSPTTGASSAPTTTVTAATRTTTTTAAPAPVPAAAEPATSATPEDGPEVTRTTVAAGAVGPAESTAAGPAKKRRRAPSGGGFAGNVVIVVGPTLAGLALGARLRRREA